VGQKGGIEKRKPWLEGEGLAEKLNKQQFFKWPKKKGKREVVSNDQIEGRSKASEGGAGQTISERSGKKGPTPRENE